MFFTGTISPAKLALQRLVSGTTGEWFVGCSGNFSFEKILHNSGATSVHSNDVSLYSRIVASTVLGDNFELRCVDTKLMEIFSAWPKSAYTKYLQVCYALTYKKFEGCKNAYQAYMFNALQKGANTWYEKELSKIEKRRPFDFKIDSFCFGDVRAFLADTSERARFAVFAPTYVGGYEKIFGKLDEVFDYDKPTYEIWNPADADPFYRNLLRSREGLCFTDRPLEECGEFLSAIVRQRDPAKKAIHIYSSLSNKKTLYLAPLVSHKKVKGVKIIDAQKETVNEVGFSICGADVVNRYRSLFMSKKVLSTADVSGLCLAFLADGEVFGFAVFKPFFDKTENDGIYAGMVADFVLPSRIPKLSKLLLYCVKSEEVARAVRRRFGKKYTGIETTVFTSKPCSMKYRGPFTKYQTRKNPDRILYRALFEVKQTLQEALTLWKKKI